MILGFYGIADDSYPDVEGQARLLWEGGVEAIQLRCKGWTTEARVRLVERLPRGPRWIVNDDVAAARACGAWAHLGRGDGEDPRGVRFGRSTHAAEEAGAPGSASYIGFGPVFATRTKRSGREARGLVGLAAAVRASPVPVVAIGGIALDNLDGVRATGVAAWTAIEAVWGHPDPAAQIRAFRAR